MYTITFAMLAFFWAYLADNTIGFRVGGLSELKDATPKTQQLVDSVSILFFLLILDKLVSSISYAKVIRHM